MSKGSNPRPFSVSPEEFASRWERTFGSDPKGGERSGGWNFRVFEVPEGVSVREVYYDSEGCPEYWTQVGLPVAAEDVEGLRWILRKVSEALSKPPLKEEDLLAQAEGSRRDSE